MKETIRCSVCNGVSSPAIATNQEDYRVGRFSEDPTDPTKMICSECVVTVGEVDAEWLDTIEEEMGDLDEGFDDFDDLDDWYFGDDDD